MRDILRAGTDLDFGDFVSKYAPSALAQGLITEQDLDARLRNLFKMRLRLGHFDPPSPLDKISLEEVPAVSMPCTGMPFDSAQSFDPS